MDCKYTYELTPYVLEDIEAALAYIAEKLSNKKAAEELFKEIEKTIDTICAFPASSADCTCFLITNKNIRHVQVKNYTLIYEISEEQAKIKLLYFRYARMDISNLRDFL